ncbi:adenylate/guanylate cyclase domain-containing protein [Paraburkholderia acidiphila]|uniref:Adenylate/guanylate cyclase domain-containing protein n=1 Tax=Paraburkholderia acidiphila TaxID=2571747 RepID=A0A7Z2G5D5_9BURK|nr:adenylate/guanylate cyclase domain-containing protein [Paraburkholderia acidiphila]QGZ55084.1 adenylate/guanylate cyclase domain-containing protein [Paraburkholderia acidiphila]
MESNWRKYSSNDSDGRIRAILDLPAGNYQEVEAIPARSRLTFDNGFYVKCAAVFIDIRGSSSLPDKHTRPVLGKIYRTYISECSAVLNSYTCCKEIYVAGDCVSGIFDTSAGSGVQEAFNAACALNALVQHLNYRFEQKGYVPIRCGIGVAYGRALMIKSGFNGASINEVVWMGDVVNEASNLCHQGNRDGSAPIQVSSEVYQKLGPSDRFLLQCVFAMDASVDHYQGDLVNIEMKQWLHAQVSRDRRPSLIPNALLNLPTLSQYPQFGLGSLLSPPPPSTQMTVAPLLIPSLLGDLSNGGTTPLSLADLLKPQPPFPNSLLGVPGNSTSLADLLREK